MGFGTVVKTKLTLGINVSPTRSSCCCWSRTSKKGGTWQPTIISPQWIGHNVAKKNKTSLPGTVNKVRKEAPAVVQHMKEPLNSTTLYKSGDATMTVYQSKAKKNVIIFGTLHPSIAVADNSKKILERVNLYIDKNMMLILSITWQGNAQLELAPDDDLQATFDQ